MNKYLFIISLPRSGSTALWQLLKTSPNVSALAKEGHLVANQLLKSNNIMDKNDRWNPTKKIPWAMVKKKWEDEWNIGKPVLLEKSPPHLIRVQEIEKRFPNCFFVILVRNPYAFCEGERRRFDDTYYNIARFWVACCKYQLDNIKNIKNNIYFTYEELTDHPHEVCDKIINFVPEIKELDITKTLIVKEKSIQLTNLNEQQISRLSSADIWEINQVLQNYPDIMNFFRYEYLKPSKKVRLKHVTKLFIRISSKNKHYSKILNYNKSKLTDFAKR